MDFELEPSKIFFKKPEKKTDTVIIDLGTYEIKAGFLNDVCLIIPNRIFKYKNKVDFNPFPNANKLSMFEADVITNFDVLELIFNLIFEKYLHITQFNKIILMTTPCSPTNPALVDFLFEKYKFKEIQIGYDFIYAYHKYFNMDDCLIVSISYSNVFVAYVFQNQITYIQKIPFGIADLLEYIKQSMQLRFKNFRKDYGGLIYHLRVALNYREDALNILEKMYNKDYSSTLFLSDEQVEETENSEEIKSNKPIPKSNFIEIPNIDYALLETDDNNLSKERISEKKKNKLIFYSTLARLKSKIAQSMEILTEILENNLDELEKKNNITQYIKNKKAKFEILKNKLKERENLRKNVKNKKTIEYIVKYKEYGLTEEEFNLQDKIAEAEDLDLENKLLKQLNDEAASIKALDPNFIPFHATTFEILRGLNINRDCIAIELIKWPEIFFHPQILNMQTMGLSEILSNISKEVSIKNVLITGGMGHLTGLTERIYSELICRSKTGDIIIKTVDNTQTDPFNGCYFSPLFQTYKK